MRGVSSQISREKSRQLAGVKLLGGDGCAGNGRLVVTRGDLCDIAVRMCAEGYRGRSECVLASGGGVHLAAAVRGARRPPAPP